jgi:hypothetical protein
VSVEIELEEVEIVCVLITFGRTSKAPAYTVVVLVVGMATFTLRTGIPICEVVES